MELPNGTIRKHLRRWESGPPVRFLTFSCYRNLPLLDSREVRDDFASSLARARDRYGFRLIAWVVMPDHVHLMIVPVYPAGVPSPMPSILRSIKQPVAQRLIRSGRFRGLHLEAIKTNNGETRIWQEGGGFDRNVRNDDELRREIDYIHQNPIEAGLVDSPTDWEWSSARWYAGLHGEAHGWGGRIGIDRTGVDW